MNLKVLEAKQKIERAERAIRFAKEDLHFWKIKLNKLKKKKLEEKK